MLPPLLCYLLLLMSKSFISKRKGLWQRLRDVSKVHFMLLKCCHAGRCIIDLVQIKTSVPGKPNFDVLNYLTFTHAKLRTCPTGDHCLARWTFHGVVEQLMGINEPAELLRVIQRRIKGLLLLTSEFFKWNWFVVQLLQQQ